MDSRGYGVLFIITIIIAIGLQQEAECMWFVSRVCGSAVVISMSALHGP